VALARPFAERRRGIGAAALLKAADERASLVGDKPDDR
jgi:hypothetical protein